HVAAADGDRLRADPRHTTRSGIHAFDRQVLLVVDPDEASCDDHADGQGRPGEDRMDLVRGRVDAVHRTLQGTWRRPARIGSYLVTPSRPISGPEADDPRDRKGGSDLHRPRVDPPQRPAMPLAVRADLAEDSDPHRVMGDRHGAVLPGVPLPGDPNSAHDPVGLGVDPGERPCPCTHDPYRVMGDRHVTVLAAGDPNSARGPVGLGSIRYSVAALRTQIACRPAATVEGVPATRIRATTAGLSSAGR